MIVAALLLQAAAPAAILNAPSSTIAAKRERRYQGVWFDAFEGQAFYRGATTASDVDTRKTAPWLEIDRLNALNRVAKTPKSLSTLLDPYTPRLYRITFIGTEAHDEKCVRPARRNGGSLPPMVPMCFGHIGASSDIIIVKRLLTIEPLGASISSGNRR